MFVDPFKPEDNSAFQSLLELHRGRAYAIAFRMLRNPADAMDVAQDAFLKAWTYRRLWGAVEDRGFRLWLRRVVINRCIDFHRQRGFECLDELPEPADTAADVVTVLYHRQVAERLAVAVQALPRRQRQAITLAYFEDLANADIAKAMGTTVKAAESLLKHGRNRLRQVLRTYPE